uniref:SFRICE_003441 n=1 Tax=Spodoptera frugiperda TaxID=7108 RepID=A0A2H1WAU0_SPOFR
MQSTRVSPFELTDGLCRTADKWSKMELDWKRTKKVSISEIQTNDDSLLSGPIIEEMSETIHPNTENISSESEKNAEVVESKTNVAVQAEPSAESIHLPDVIITNPHKLISPMGSQYCGLSYRSLFSDEGLTDGINTELVMHDVEQQVSTEAVVNTEIVTHKTEHKFEHKPLETHKAESKTKASAMRIAERIMVHEAMASIVKLVK